jgi:hypothetical protein
MALLSRPVRSGKFAAFTHWTCLRFPFFLFLTCFVVGTKSVASFFFFCTSFRMPNLLESGSVSTQALGVSFCYRGGSGIKNDWKGGREGGRKNDRAPKVSYRINCERDKSVAC